MYRLIVALAVIAALAGCSSTHTLAACKGPLIVLNPEQWHPTATEIAAIDRACPEDK